MPWCGSETDSEGMEGWDKSGGRGGEKNPVVLVGLNFKLLLLRNLMVSRKK